MELRDYLRLVRTYGKGVIALTLLSTLAAFGWSVLQPRVYTASASGIVQATAAGADVGSALVGNQLAQSKVSSYVDIGGWRSVAEHAIDELGLATTPAALVARVRVSHPLDTVIINVVADAASPEAARDLAEAWIRGMVTEINILQTGSPDRSGAVALVAGQAAALPAAPSSPNVRLIVALGALSGVALGLAYALVRHVLDRRVRHPRDVEREAGLSVMGTIPLDPEISSHRRLYAFDGGRSGSDPVAEAMRELRTNLQFMDVDDPPRVIVVTSPLPGDGKSSTAANLALSLAAAGRRTVLVDADLRRPVIGAVFGLPDGAGLTDALAARADLAALLHPVDGNGTLSVLPAGRIPPNPSEVLGSQRMRDLLGELSRTATVVLDSPPAIPVTDTAVLSAAADGVILVVSAGRTTHEVLQRAASNIARAQGRVLGVVLNKVPLRRGDTYGYGYRPRPGEPPTPSPRAAGRLPTRAAGPSV